MIGNLVRQCSLSKALVNFIFCWPIGATYQNRSFLCQGNAWWRLSDSETHGEERLRIERILVFEGTLFCGQGREGTVANSAHFFCQTSNHISPWEPKRSFPSYAHSKMRDLVLFLCFVGRRILKRHTLVSETTNHKSQITNDISRARPTPFPRRVVVGLKMWRKHNFLWK